MIGEYFDFDERLRMSHGVIDRTDSASILMALIPGALSVRRSDLTDDRNGVDLWVSCEGGKDVSVDVKARSKDWSLDGQDDLALELWSVRGSVTGWSLRTDKLTDFILWIWTDPRRPGARFCLVPFKMLVSVFASNLSTWTARHRSAIQPNKGWDSECVFVPRREVWAAIYRKFAGAPPPPRKAP